MTDSQIIWTTCAALVFIIIAALRIIENSEKLLKNPMTPFCRMQGNTPFNFKRMLTRQNLSKRQLRKLYGKVVNFNTCATANLPQVIPRYSMSSAPHDDILRDLGINFSLSCSLLLHCENEELTLQQEKCLRILRQIELRGQILTGEAMAYRAQNTVLHKISSDETQ